MAYKLFIKYDYINKLVIRIILSIIKLLCNICRIMNQRNKGSSSMNSMIFQMKKALNARLLR